MSHAWLATDSVASQGRQARTSTGTTAPGSTSTILLARTRVDLNFVITYAYLC